MALTKRMVREEATILFQTDRYHYRRIYGIPRNDDRETNLTDLEISIELEAHRRYTLRMNGKDEELFESDPLIEEGINAIESGATFEDSIPEEFKMFFENNGSLDIGSLFNNNGDDVAEGAP